MTILLCRFVQRVVASKPGMVTSDVRTSLAYTTRQIAAAPVFTPDGGTHDTNQRHVNTTISTTTAATRIRYTVNSHLPTRDNGTLGNRQSWFSTPTRDTYTVKALAFKAGWADSDVSTSESYITKAIVAAPVFLPDGATHVANTRSVAFSASSSTSGTTTRYLIHTNQGPTRTSTMTNMDGNNYIEISNLPAMSTQRFSMGAWFKTSTGCPDGRDWMGAGAGLLRATVHSNGKPKLGSNHSTNGVSVGDGALVMRDGAWHHLLVTYGRGDVKLYVDGEEEQSAPAVEHELFTAVRFGASFSTANTCIMADTHNAMVWASELTPRMVQSVYSGAEHLLRYHPQPDFFFKLDDSWDEFETTSITREGTALCTDCVVAPEFKWKSYAVQDPRYETAGNPQVTGLGSGLKVTGWDYFLVELPSNMSTVGSTIAAWVKTEQDSPDWAEWWGAESFNLRLETRPSGCPQLYSEGDSTNGQSTSDAIARVRDGHWHHLAVVYGLDGVELFVDGESQLVAPAFTPRTFSKLKVCIHAWLGAALLMRAVRWEVHTSPTALEYEPHSRTCGYGESSLGLHKCGMRWTCLICSTR